MRAQDQEPTSTSRSRQPQQAPSPAPTAAHPATPLALLQRSIGNAAVTRLVEAQRQSRDPVQRSAVPDVLRSPGHPLDDDTRTEMEARLGADFSGVRLHTDAVARDSAAEVGARAYTSGEHVVIGDGGDDAHTLAHELTHVLQQRRGPVSGTDTGTGLHVSDPRDRFEREAEHNARRALSRPAPPTEAHLAGSDTGNGQAAIGPIQRVPPRGGNKRKRADTAADMRPAGQKSIMEFGISAPLAAEKERAETQNKAEMELASQKDSHGRHDMFIEALHKKFNQSDDWTTKGDAKKFYAIRNNDQQSAPHDYKDEPEVESLRWISTVLKRYLINDGQDPVEVQAAIGDGGDLIIAANNAAANAYLMQQLRPDGMSFIGTALDTGRLTESQFEENWRKNPSTKNVPLDEATKKAAVGREERHFDNLGLMHSGRDDEVSKKYKKVLDAIRSDVVVADDGGGGLHAERRIKIRNGKKTPDYLAGTKRPCATCFSELYPGTSETALNRRDATRPGIFFSNRSSNVDIPEYQDDRSRAPSQRAEELFKRINKNVPRTHVTRARNGAIVFDTGSDSE